MGVAVGVGRCMRQWAQVRCRVERVGKAREGLGKIEAKARARHDKGKARQIKHMSAETRGSLSI